MIVAYNQRQKYILAKDAQKNQSYFCPGCREPVMLKVGDVKQKHFAHYSVTLCQTLTENETTAHLSGKMQLAQYLQQFGHVEIEAVIASIQQRPDILLTQGNQKLAIEYQCSPISQKRLMQRNAGYQSCHIKVIWILGETYYHRNLSQKTILKFMAAQQIVFYLSSNQMFVHRHHFIKADFSRVKYTEKCHHDLFIKPLQSLTYQHDVNKQRYKVHSLLMQQRVDKFLINHLYQHNRRLPDAPEWVFQGCTFGLNVANWHFRLLVVLLLEKIGLQHVIKKEKLSQILAQYFLGDDDFKIVQLRQIFCSLENHNFILQQGGYILIRRLPKWLNAK
ncbi:competence protein CoiA [Leuconostoc falkenbergense]|uniref:competence protein CoiA n=1 Tax=Leuconostoc falkenbergense TaxID=2766470 RepID=UPI0021A6BD60|nr:competence protein CoiA family protein [Leuconostoc falkenbergense]MCT4388810.1 competence protein [Leuconostoc falkenbergense]